MGTMSIFDFLHRRPVQTVPAAPVAVAPLIAPPDIPRYPPFLQGIPVVASAHLLTTQAELVDKLRYGIGCTPDFFQTQVRPVVDRFAAFVHLLPASEAHHHRGAGGLLHHSLEVAFWAGQASAGKVFAMDREPAVRRVHEPLWRLAAALAGLCHDIGKPISDLSVTNRDGTLTWSPMHETIAQWAARHGLESYYLHWRERRHNRHQSVGMFAVERVLGRDVFAMLFQADPEIGNAMIDAVAGANEQATLTQLVSNADRASVERDLKSNRIDPQATSLGVPIERYLLDAMARLVRAGTWGINTPGSRLWMLGDSLYVVWPQGGDEIVAVLAADRVPGIPRHPDTLADLLIERGYAVPPGEGDGVRRYWRLAPAPLARDGKPVTLTLLRLTSPHHVLSGLAPAPVGLVGDAVVPTPGPVLGRPLGTPNGGSRPELVDSCADDAARRDEAMRLGLEWDDDDDVDDPDAVDSLDATAILPSVVDAPPPSAADRVRSVVVPTLPLPVRMGRAPSPIEQAAQRLRQPRPVTTTAAAPSTPAALPRCLPDPGTVAEAWFHARRSGVGARLLLALAATIRTGDCAAAAVLYLPDQPGDQLWIRVPEGLAGVGADLEVQIAALWDDDLVAVDILKPYLRVRVVDGVRGVALKVEASGYFAALLPAGALERCTPGALAATLPAGASPPTLPSAASPDPTAAVAAASSSPRSDATARARPSLVADALLARVRAAHAATGAAATCRLILLTPADIGVAAQAAGLKDISLRRALAHRPGCEMTIGGGAQVTAE
ncbi:MobH family relaxase [uncultured Thiodictyon sp.]|uniref:MobH family relaxase n=3 Tax=uncultured Thiodictyon sp. TaxID=1846217 RepID=UPI0025D8448C|nr:MobH family relaxase [uncultured Thiodictyon sp.]